MLTLTLTFSLIFWARRDVGDEEKSCRPHLSISNVPLVFVTTDVFLASTCSPEKMCGEVGVMGSLTLSCCGRWCNHVSKDDFTWSHVEEAAAGERANARLTGMRWEVSRKAWPCVSQQEGEKKSIHRGRDQQPHYVKKHSTVPS